MKKTFAALFSTLTLTTMIGCSVETTSAVHSTKIEKASITLELPAAGIDYPTDAPPLPELKNKLVLAVNETNRIVVDGDTQLVDPVAGLDYPTDAPKPEALAGVKILVLDQGFRLPIRIELAKAGLDFPTDGGPKLDRDFLVWDMGMHQRARLSNVKGIVKAEAGIDFPTDGPADLERDFYVYESLNADYGLDRIAIKASR